MQRDRNRRYIVRLDRRCVFTLPTIVFVPADKYRAVTRTEGMLPAQVIIECLQEDAGLEIPDDWTGYEHLPQVDYRDRQS